jgi:serine protease AprX
MTEMTVTAASHSSCPLSLACILCTRFIRRSLYLVETVPVYDLRTILYIDIFTSPLAKMVRLTIHGNTVDLERPSDGQIPTSVLDQAREKPYLLVTTKGSPSKAEFAELQASGVSVLQYVGKETYLCRYPGTDAEAIVDKPFIETVQPYFKDFKITKTLRNRLLPEGIRQEVRVVLHEDASRSTKNTASNIAQAAGLPAGSITIRGNSLELPMSHHEIHSVSMLDEVKVIEEVLEKGLSNNIARDILGVNVADVSSQLGLADVTKFQGLGEVVTVSDTGLDLGSLQDIHPAFQGRVIALSSVVGRPKADDPDGHGTHMCGSILGGLVPGSSIPVQGTAPKAELIMQGIGKQQGGKFGPYPPSGEHLEKLWSGPPRTHGSWIHCNAWAPGWTVEQQAYNDEARILDQCVRDQPELLICFAAGNYGSQSAHATIGALPSAKNCLTVGATESVRASMESKLQEGIVQQNDSTQIAYYSDHGPTTDGRIKPDVVAPGTTILSARTRHPSFKGFGKGECDDHLWTYNSGTSMATPLVAGCAAVLREYLRSLSLEHPSAALLKALLINGAFSLHHANNNREGFGRVNVRNSMKARDAANSGFFDDRTFDGSKQEHSITLKIDETTAEPSLSVMDYNVQQVSPPAATGTTLKVTLVYTDLPQAPLQNNLNLCVIGSNGAERHGNMGSSSRYDNTNNVEQVVWKGVPTGEVTVKILAQRILPNNDQGYALVWRVIPNEI